jgi:transposase-like protein
VLLALLAGAVLCAAVAILARHVGGDRWRLRPRAARGVLAGAGVALVVVSVLFGPAAAESAWDDFRAAPPATDAADPAARLTNLGGERYEVWRAAFNAFEREPLKGIGAGSYEFWSARTEPDAGYQRDGHSLYLEVLGELGVPGLLLLLVALGGLGIGSVRSVRTDSPPGDAGARAALVAGFGVFAFHAGVDWLWELTAVSAMALAALAIASAGGKERERRGAWGRGSTVGARIGVALLALVAILVQLPGLVSTSTLRSSQAAARAGDLKEARADAVDAVEAQPWAASPRVQLALVDEVEGRLRSASVRLQEAVEREPTNWRHRLLVARVEAERGHVAKALAAARAARRLKPDTAFLPEREPR